MELGEPSPKLGSELLIPPFLAPPVLLPRAGYLRPKPRRRSGRKGNPRRGSSETLAKKSSSPTHSRSTHLPLPSSVADHGKQHRKDTHPDKGRFDDHRGRHEPLEEIIQRTGHSLALLGKMANRLRMRSGTARISQFAKSTLEESSGHITSTPIHPVSHPPHHERDDDQEQERPD